MNARNTAGDTALALAAFRGHLRIVETLIAKGASQEVAGWPPLVYAAFGGHGEIVDYLVKHQALIDAQSSNGMTDWRPRVTYPPIRIARFSDELVRRGVEHKKIAETSVPVFGVAKTVADLFRYEFSRAGYDPDIAPIYAHALVSMVTQVGQWWATQGRGVPVDYVVQHVSALGWRVAASPEDSPAPPAQAPQGAPRAVSTFTPDEEHRYTRHLIHPELGVKGQKRLKVARVLVVGAGGSVVAADLA